MSHWTAQQLRDRFLEFFRQHGHAIIPSASVIPEHDPSVLFTTAGMHPLVPYLLGQEHPAGKRLANIQKCIRTGDIDEVGDNRHLTFFEMLGNWSLGDYFKEDAIRWSWEFLTGDAWLALDPQRLAVSVFAGDADAARDDESVAIWRKCGVPDARIAYLGKDDNWWPAGGKHPGPQGPDTEMFYWIPHTPAPERFDPTHPGWVEIWNNVFMQFNRTAEGTYELLAQRNVDTGMGLERILTVLTGKQTVYETDLFTPILERIGTLAGAAPTTAEQERASRMIADHIRAATFILGDPFGIAPSNVDQGYVLRKLIRRAIRGGRGMGLGATPWTALIAATVIDRYCDTYPELEQHRSRILFELQEEEERFREALDRGMRHYTARTSELPPHAPISGVDAFALYETFGFPIEITEDLAREEGRAVNRAEFVAAMQAHQEQSRAATGQRFAGGLADHSDQSIRYHTATHLLHQALRTVLGDHVAQRGSNITPERLRFDFHHPQKVTPEEVQRVNALVQAHIDADLPVHYELLSVAEAKEVGAIGLFEDTYAALGERVKVYFIGDASHGFVSTEICGGPHVARTGLIGTFRIVKEEASSQGVRRIKAVIDPTDAPVTVAALAVRS
ncbi:alanine--tRNA ligase [Candidatus Uhrbacteria bacterium]|nr:alanine--tRNA ligase [Candidatus Uhrbacteria bacterium]